MMFDRLKGYFFGERKENKRKAMKGEVTAPIVPPLKERVFFNRLKEQEKLNKLFTTEPRLSLLIGPPSCGKTSMVLYLLEKLSHTRPIIHINLRGMSFSNADELYFALDRKISPFLFKAKSYIPSKVKIAGLVEFERDLKQGEREISAAEKFNGFFEKITEAFSQSEQGKENVTPILFIDEAHALFSLAKAPEGNEVLYNLFQWFTFSSKEELFFHVLLASKDSFFYQWVERYIEAIHYKVYLMEDLSKEKAKTFWEEYLPPKYLKDKREIPPFEEAYEVCGGKMLLLKDYFFHYLHLGTSFPADTFPLVIKEYQRFFDAIYSKENLFPGYYEEANPTWKREDLEKMMKMLVEAPQGFLLYEEVCARLGASVVRSLIQYHLIYMLPYKINQEEPSEIIEHKPVILPVNASSLRAMKVLLQGIKEGRI